MIPRIAVGAWRRRLATYWDPKTDLYTLATEYAEGVRRAGGIPLIVPHLDPAEVGTALDAADGVLLTGGPDMDPARYEAENTSSWRVDPGADASEVALVRGALDRDLPILGVCRGIQVVNVALGGDLVQEIQAEGSEIHPTYGELEGDMRELRHPVVMAPGSRLATLYGDGELIVNSLHHQAVGRVAEGLEVVGTAPDGTVEAIEGDGVLAVQWHPEMILDEGGQTLFDDLVARARR